MKISFLPEPKRIALNFGEDVTQPFFTDIDRRWCYTFQLSTKISWKFIKILFDIFVEVFPVVTK